jgi:CO/xanthine dehydrogenase FAD-binding subunit
MTLPRFEYLAPRTVEEAIAFWAEEPGGAYFSGGTDLLPQLRAGRKQATRVIDVKKIAGLHEIREGKDGSLAVGAAVPLATLETHPAVVQRFPLLAECSRTIGAWPLRNRATMAGNICNASPAADTAVALLALDAVVRAEGPLGTRSIPVAALFLGPGKTALLPGELVVEVVIPGSAAGWDGRYLRLSRRQGMDLATVGVLVARSHDNGWRRHRIALAAVAPTPMRVPAAEALLDANGTGAAPEAAAIAQDSCSPITDVRGTAAYRREMVGVLVNRGLLALC